MSGLELAVLVELLVDDVLGFLRQLDRRIAEEEILVRVDRMLVGGKRQPRGEAVAGRGRAIEIIGFDGELQRLAGLDRRPASIERSSFRRSGRNSSMRNVRPCVASFALRIGAELDLPAAGRRIGRNLARPFEIAELLRIELAPRRTGGRRAASASGTAAAA